MQPIMSPEADLAKDQLWKYQLRREHATLLDDMNMQKIAFTTFAEEAKATQEHLQEQLSSLKSKFDKLTDDNEKYAQEIKDLLKDVQKKAAEVEKIRAELNVVGVRVKAAAGIEDNALETAVTATPMPISKGRTKVPTKASTTTSTRRSSPQSAGSSNIKPPHNVANTGLRKSRRQAHLEPSQQVPRTYAKLPQPPLNQDGVSFEEFFLRVDKISAAIDPAKQTPLVAMFVTGLVKREEQDTIVEELCKKGMSEVLGNGQVEMKCNWADLKNVLKTVGLIGTVAIEEEHLLENGKR